MLRPLALLATLALPAAAQETAWPAELASLIEEASTACQGDFSVAPEAVSQHDLNDDGNPDWILDTAGLACADGHGMFCGTQGCGVETLIDGIRGSLLLRNWEVVTEGGTTYLTAPNDKGQTVRFLWMGADWQLQ